MENETIKTLLEQYDRITRENETMERMMLQAMLLDDKQLQSKLAVCMQLREAIGRAINMKQYWRAEKLLFILLRIKGDEKEEELKKALGKKMCKK